jgi:hypothetical protein
LFFCRFHQIGHLPHVRRCFCGGSCFHLSIEAEPSRVSMCKPIITTAKQGTTPLQLLLAWGFVGIPLILGVLQTLVNSMKLFQ